MPLLLFVEYHYILTCWSSVFIKLFFILRIKDWH